MTESSTSVEVEDFVECLRDENKRLIRKLNFAKKCVQLFEDYRKCLVGFANQCRCEDTFDHQISFNHLERRYQRILEEDRTPALEVTAVNTKFNKEQTRSSDDRPRLPIVGKECIATDSSISEHLLSDKLEECLKNINDNDYKLIFLKNKTDINEDNDVMEYFKCNWFKCEQIFDSQSTLSQHIKVNHFRVYEDNNDPLISSEPQEMVIEYYPNKEETDSKTKLESKPRRAFEEYVCDWVGCHLRFKSQSEMKYHKKCVHNCETSSSQQRFARFSGLKPLTIHTLESISEPSPGIRLNDKPFGCDLCDKTYSRKDSLKYHMSSEHKTGSIATKMHSCDHCEYETRNVGHMNRHILRKHSDQRPFKCSLDGCHPAINCFATQDQLIAHQTRSHLTSSSDHLL